MQGALYINSARIAGLKWGEVERMRLVDADKIHRELTALYKNAQHEARQAYSRAIDIVCDADTVEAEPAKHGRWIPVTAYNENDIAYCDYMCSECGHEITKRVFCVPNHCESCGSKMDGGAKKENDTADK